MRVEESELRTAQVSDLCKRRLLNYADSFHELARSYEMDFHPEEWKGREKVLSERRLWENRQVLKGHLIEMAKIMTEVACEVLCYRPLEEKKKRMLVRWMKEEGILVENPCYLPTEDGNCSLVLTMSTDRKSGISAEEATDMISVLLNRRFQLSVTSPYLIEKKPHSFILEEESKYIALTGFAKAIREGETVSGDNYAVLEAEKGRVTVMLSDGTGSGEQANRDSSHVLDLMEKFLEAGYSTDSAIRMVNTALYALDNDSNHPSLDVCDINLHKGCCEIRKVGGAISFLKREGRVDSFLEGNLPLGVLQQMIIPPFCHDLQDGDYLIMVSDGIVDAFGDHCYQDSMEEMIGELKEQNPGELAERILRKAIIAGGGRIRDDMTVGVIGIWENSINPG